MAAKWHELRPYQTDSADSGPRNMQQILSHIERFLLVVCCVDYKVRLYIRCAEPHRATLDGMDGIEAVPCTAFEFTGYRRYRKYSLRRHCAVPISNKDMERTSIYHTLNSDVEHNAFLSLYIRRMDAAPPINNYIRDLEHGKTPGSIFGFFSTGTGKTTVSGRQKIRNAQQKQMSGLFLCKMFAGSMEQSDIRSIEGSFPAKAFTSKTLDPKKLRDFYTGSLTLPLFGASRRIILSNEELTGMLVLPEQRDMATVNFEFGKIASESAGLPGGSID